MGQNEVGETDDGVPELHLTLLMREEGTLFVVKPNLTAL